VCLYEKCLRTLPDFFEQVNAISVMYPRPRILRIWLLFMPYVIVYGADEVETILTSNLNLNKSREYNLLLPWLGRGLLTRFHLTIFVISNILLF
jgi:hypothetical protein